MNDAAQGCIPHQLINCSECRKDNLIRTQRNEIERLRDRNEKLRNMLAQMKTEAPGRLLGYPHWLEEILNAE